MPTKARTQRIRDRLNQPWGKPGASPLTRLQRRARDVISMASVCLFFACGWWLLVALFSWQANWLPAGDIGHFAARRVLEDWHLMPSKHFDRRLLILAWVLGFGATLAPLLCLRKLGKTLYLQSPLSFAVAHRFRWLAHALVGNIVISGVVSWLASGQIPQYRLTIGIGFWGTLIAALLAYAVSDLVDEGARANQENREFV